MPCPAQQSEQLHLRVAIVRAPDPTSTHPAITHMNTAIEKKQIRHALPPRPIAPLPRPAIPAPPSPAPPSPERRIFTRHERSSHMTGALLLAIASTMLLFGAVPVVNFLSVDRGSQHLLTVATHIDPPPPPPQDDPPPPPEEQKEVEKPRLDEKPPPLTLAAIDAILNPGTGDASADMGFGQTLAAFDALDEMMVFELGELDKHPVPIQRIGPIFPYVAKQAGLTGWVKVVFVVDQTGSVVTPRVEDSSHREFETPALEAIRLWKFVPGVRDGKNVRTRMMQPFNFNIRE